MTAIIEPAVGRPLDRRDGKAKTTGAALFAAEFSYPDIAHAALVHSTVARGRITRIESGAAAAIPGVIDIITHRNAPRPRPGTKVLCRLKAVRIEQPATCRSCNGQVECP